LLVEQATVFKIFSLKTKEAEKTIKPLKINRL